MCGIVGYTGNHIRKIKKLQQTLKHRGPDDEGSYSDKDVSLAQTRLSILDLTDAGHQPMFYIPGKGACSQKHHPELIEQSNLAVVYNGEIYNFHEVRSLLHGKGYKFSTECDTELILAAYSEWGTNFLDRLNGMWAFCLYDMKNEVLFLSRDRLGIKPLYYHYDNEEFIFASELKPFYLSGIDKEINKKSLNHYYLLNTSHSEEAILKGVKKLPAGTNLIYDLKSKKIGLIEQYKKNKFSGNIYDENEAKEKILKLLQDSVKKRMLSDVEVGAFLSGGIDSSAIVMFMREFTDKLKTFSIKFDYEDYNEAHYAKIISDKFKTDHYEIAFNAGDVKNLIETLPQFYDEPFGDSSMIPTYLVSKVASDHVKVILSGTGGDEIFAGYERYKEYFKLLKFRNFPGLARSIATAGYRRLNRDKAGKLKQLMKTKDNKLLYIKLLSDGFRNENETHFNLDNIDELFPLFGNMNGINSLLSFDQNHYLFNDLLIKEDRATMANSIEGRVPFLDHRLVDYANSLNPNLKIKNGSLKYILKESLRGYLPDEIIDRRKKGFGVPLKHYLRNELKDYAKELIFDGIKYFPELSEEYVSGLWELHINEESDYSSFFWNLIMLIKWYEMYMK